MNSNGPSLAGLPAEDQNAVIYGVADATGDLLAALNSPGSYSPDEVAQIRQFVEQLFADLGQKELPPGLWDSSESMRAPQTRREAAPGMEDEDDEIFLAAWSALRILLSNPDGTTDVDFFWNNLRDVLRGAVGSAIDACCAPSFAETFENLLPAVPPEPIERMFPRTAAELDRYKVSMVGLLVGVREGISHSISVEYADGWDVALIARHKQLYGVDLDEELIEIANEGVPEAFRNISPLDFEMARQHGIAAGYNAYNDVFSAFLNAGAAPEALDWAPTARAPLVLAASLDRVAEALAHDPR